MIIGSNIRLIPLNEEIFNLTLNWINKPELRYYTGARFPVNKMEHEKWFSNKSLNAFNKTFGIQIKETNEIVGIIGNDNYDSINRTSSLFLYLGSNKIRNLGIGNEALNLMIEFCFNSLNIYKLWVEIFDYNIGSLKLFQKNNFNKEGILKKHWFKDGEYHDVILLGRFSNEKKNNNDTWR